MRTAIVLLALAVLPASGASFSGRVVDDHAGAAVPSADIRVYKNGVRGLTAELETNGEGRFSADGLPDGEYRIEISKPNHISASVRTTITASSPATLLLRLVRCGSIAGRVLTSDGQPIRGAIAYAMRMESGVLRQSRAPGRTSDVDDDGRYRLYDLPPGQYVLAVAYGASTVRLGSIGEAPPVKGIGSGVQFFPSSARPQPFLVASGETFRGIDVSVLPMNLYAVSGTVTAGAEPKSQGRFWLSLVMPEQPGIALAATSAKEDGSFRFEGIAPGTYDLFASGPSRGRSGMGAMLDDTAQFARSRVTVGSQDVEGLALTTDKGLTVALTLQAPATGCNPSAQMTVASLEDWAAMLEQQASLTANEPTTLKQLAPARYRISVTGLGETCYVPDGMVLDMTVPREGPTLIKAISAGAIVGVLAGEGARAGVMVMLADAADGSQSIQLAAADAQLRFTFGPLRPGRYRIGTRTSEGKLVDVAAGEPVRVELPLP